MDLVRRHEDGYHFMGDRTSGVTFRWGNAFSQNPVRAPWPELADISISNYCTNRCEYCYRGSSEQGATLSLTDYRFILEQLTSSRYGPVFQVALGGGEPLLHPEIIEILRTTRQDYGIIPNYTTSGLFFTPEILAATKEYCGAIAVSYDPYRKNMDYAGLQEIGQTAVELGIKTNIHFVVSEQTIGEAIEILEGRRDAEIQPFHAVVFLTYKPFGNAGAEDCLKTGPQLERFLHLVENPVTERQFGFDACFVPYLLRKTKVDADFLDSCECGFFSVYVNEKMEVSPCSFCGDGTYTFSLRQERFENIWEDHFRFYRDKVLHNCGQECAAAQICRGKCEFFKELFLCSSL